MPTFRATIQYDGGAYAGFQTQKNASTVQDTVEGALTRVTGTPVRVIGAGRTDAGVHARGQVISFNVETRLDPGSLLRALNAVLPADIVVLALHEAPEGFNARFDARARAYEYVVYNDALPSPFWRLYSFHVSAPLDVESMHDALSELEGRHDFAAFGMPMERTRHGVTVRGGTERSLLRAHCRSARPFVYFYLEADAFLRHMVRLIVGTILKVGRSRLAPSDVTNILRGGRIAASGPAAPPQGLYLVNVTY